MVAKLLAIVVLADVVLAWAPAPILVADRKLLAQPVKAVHTAVICHKTDKPGEVVEMDVDDNSIDEHRRHGDFLPLTWFVDADGDGFGDASKPQVKACTKPDGYASQAGDCDDTNPNVHPGAPEVCGDGIDQNCDGKDQSCCKPLFMDDFESGPMTRKWRRKSTQDRHMCSHPRVVPSGQSVCWMSHPSPLSGSYVLFAPFDGTGGEDRVCFRQVLDLHPDHRLTFKWNLYVSISGLPRTAGVEVWKVIPAGGVPPVLVRRIDYYKTGTAPDGRWTEQLMAQSADIPLVPGPVSQVQICMVWTIPERFTGMSTFEMDDVALAC